MELKCISKPELNCSCNLEKCNNTWKEHNEYTILNEYGYDRELMYKED